MAMKMMVETFRFPELTGSNPFFSPASSTRAPSMRSSSAVVQAPMKHPSSFFPATWLTGTTLSGDGNRAISVSIWGREGTRDGEKWKTQNTRRILANTITEISIEMVGVIKMATEDGVL